MAGTHFLIGIGNQNGKIGSKKGPESGILRNSGEIPNQGSIAFSMFFFAPLKSITLQRAAARLFLIAGLFGARFSASSYSNTASPLENSEYRNDVSDYFTANANEFAF
jgi:hypothetical protein